MSEELIKRHRPKQWSEVIGQREATKTLRGLLKSESGLPQALMLTGPSGCGKNTAARIIKDELECNDWCYKEIDCPATEKVIEAIRQIQRDMKKAPLGGKSRVWLFDEFQSLSRTSFAQQAMLKMLEEPPPNVYFILATTDSSKVIAAIKTRCTEVRMKALTPADLITLLNNTAKIEKFQLAEKVAKKIAEVADGSARKALVWLEQIIPLKDDNERMQSIQSSDLKIKAFDLVKQLMPFKGKPIWSKVAEIIESVRGEDPEGLRQLVLQVSTTHLLKGGHMAVQAFKVIQAFRDQDIADTPLAKYAALVANCFDLCNR